MLNLFGGIGFPAIPEPTGKTAAETVKSDSLGVKRSPELLQGIYLFAVQPKTVHRESPPFRIIVRE